ncbi:hypothetical protein BDFB_012286, partial [Asbolus verrucosus]
MKIARILCVDVFKLNIVKLLSVTFFVHSAMTVIQIYFFYKNFNFFFFIKYASASFSIFYLMISIDLITRSTREDFIFKLFKTLNSRKIEISDGEAYERSQGKQISFHLSSFSYPFFLSDAGDREIFYVLIFFEDYYYKRQNVFQFVYKVTFILEVYVMTAPIYQVVYIAIHFKSQILLIKNYYNDISIGYDVAENSELFYDDYQKTIKKKLVFIHRYHVNLIT